MTIGISELQKNISIFKNLKNTVEVVDKKTKEVLAFIVPKKSLTKSKTTLTESLAGSLRKMSSDDKDINNMVQKAYELEMQSKYGK